MASSADPRDDYFLANFSRRNIFGEVLVRFFKRRERGLTFIGDVRVPVSRFSYRFSVLSEIHVRRQFCSADVPP